MRKISLEEIAGLENMLQELREENEKLRSQVVELLPWAKFGAKHLLEYEHEDQTEWRVTVGVEPSTVSVEKARVFDALITNGDFGEVK